jgi:hypothetical protein
MSARKKVVKKKRRAKPRRPAWELEVERRFVVSTAKVTPEELDAAVREHEESLIDACAKTRPVGDLAKDLAAHNEAMEAQGGYASSFGDTRTHFYGPR